jgi:hypothetical protein
MPNFKPQIIPFHSHMTATLYMPGQSPQVISLEGLSMPDASTRFVKVPERVPAVLGCVPELVDVLATGPDYVAFSVFDSEDSVNLPAMAAMSDVSGIAFSEDDEDTVLRGAVLVIKAA